MSESNGSNCPVCAFKHLAAAKVAVEEFLLGWNEPIHAAKIIGNLSHCEQHLLAVGGETPIGLANDIRNWRRTFETMSGDWMEDLRPILPGQISGIAREMIAKLDEFIRRCDAVITGVEDDASAAGEDIVADAAPHEEGDRGEKDGTSLFERRREAALMARADAIRAEARKNRARVTAALDDFDRG